MFHRLSLETVYIFRCVCISFDIVQWTCEQYDLELVFVKNSHEFVHEYMKKPEFVELMRRLGALGDGNQDQSKSLFDFIWLIDSFWFYWNINSLVLFQAHYQRMNGKLHIYTSLLSWGRFVFFSFTIIMFSLRVSYDSDMFLTERRIWWSSKERREEEEWENELVERRCFVYRQLKCNRIVTLHTGHDFCFGLTYVTWPFAFERLFYLLQTIFIPSQRKMRRCLVIS